MLDHASLDLDLIIDEFNEGLLAGIGGGDGDGEVKLENVVVTFFLGGWLLLGLGIWIVYKYLGKVTRGFYKYV